MSKLAGELIVQARDLIDRVPQSQTPEADLRRSISTAYIDVKTAGTLASMRRRA